MIEQKGSKGESQSQLEDSKSHLHELQEFDPHVEAFPVDRAGGSGLQLEDKVIDDAETMPLVYRLQIRIFRRYKA